MGALGLVSPSSRRPVFVTLGVPPHLCRRQRPLSHAIGCRCDARPQRRGTRLTGRRLGERSAGPSAARKPSVERVPARLEDGRERLSELIGLPYRCLQVCRHCHGWDPRRRLPRGRRRLRVCSLKGQGTHVRTTVWSYSIDHRAPTVDMQTRILRLSWDPLSASAYGSGCCCVLLRSAGACAGSSARKPHKSMLLIVIMVDHILNRHARPPVDTFSVWWPRCASLTTQSKTKSSWQC